MDLTVNGEKRGLTPGTTVLGLLDELGMRPEVTVVERNGAIVDRAAYATVSLDDGDAIELVHFVGGG